MGLHLHYELESSFSPDEFDQRVIVPLKQALERERLGVILDRDPEDKPLAKGQYEIVLDVTDSDRAKVVVDAVLETASSVEQRR